MARIVSPFAYVMLSNAARTSPYSVTGWRIMRALCNRSNSIALLRWRERHPPRGHSGCSSAVVTLAIHEANDSLSQRSFHQAIVT